MRATTFLIAVLTATTVTAPTPRKKACDLLSVTDVERPSERRRSEHPIS